MMMTWQSRQSCIHCSGMLKLMSVSLLAEICEIIQGFCGKVKAHLQLLKMIFDFVHVPFF